MTSNAARRKLSSRVLSLACALCVAAPALAQEGNNMSDGTGSPTDLALVAPPVVQSPGPEYGPDTRPFQGIPGIERAPNGRLWATWYGGGPTEGPWNYVMLNTSADDGRTWSDVELIVNPPDPVRAFDPCLWLDPLGRMWLFWAQAWDLWDGRGGVWAIVTENPGDQSPAWGAPRRLCDGIMMNKPVVLSSGEWVLPASVWANAPSVQPGHLRQAAEPSGSNAVVSTDQGQTWAYRGGVDVPGRSCDEHHIVERLDGSLWLLARASYGIGESFSRDKGRTWTPGKPSWIPHVPTARFFIRRLASGRLLLVKHSPPDGRTRSHLTAYLSEDDGQTWQGELLVDERAGVSYPDATESPDGTVYLIYDFSRYAEKLVLLATFTEADVLAGKDVSGKLRLRVEVNRATGKLEHKPLELSQNADGAPLLTGQAASFDAQEGEWDSFERGTLLFTDRNYTADTVPDALRGARFLRGSLARISAEVAEAGVVFVLTPTPERNKDSVELSLHRAGFARVRVPEFILFGGSPANAVTLFQKQCAAEERIELGKWGVLLVPAGG